MENIYNALAIKPLSEGFIFFRLMKNIIKIFIFFAVIFITTNCISKPTQRYDNSVVEVRMPNENSVEALKNNSNFIYDAKIRTQNNFLQKLQYWLWDMFMKLFSNKGGAPLIRYFIIAAAVIFIVIKLFQTDLKSIFYSPRKRLKISHKELLEDINKMNLDKLIADAELKQNYRLAIRYLFLKKLKKLKEAELIDWKIDKTNKDYIVELKKELSGNEELKKDFDKITSIFEHIWYGNFEISKEEYKKYSLIF